MIKTILTKIGAVLILLALLIAFGVTATIASGKTRTSPVTEKDVDFMLKGIDTENKSFTLKNPENELQALMVEFVNKIRILDSEHKKELLTVEPIEFTEFEELNQTGQVIDCFGVTSRDIKNSGSIILMRKTNF